MLTSLPKQCIPRGLKCPRENSRVEGCIAPTGLGSFCCRCPRVTPLIREPDQRLYPGLVSLHSYGVLLPFSISHNQVSAEIELSRRH